MIVLHFTGADINVCSFSQINPIVFLYYILVIPVFFRPSTSLPSLSTIYANPPSHSNTIYNTKYKIVDLEVLRDTLSRCTEVNIDLNTQLSMIISDVLTTNFACNLLKYFKYGEQVIIIDSYLVKVMVYFYKSAEWVSQTSKTKILYFILCFVFKWPVPAYKFAH